MDRLPLLPRRKSLPPRLQQPRLRSILHPVYLVHLVHVVYDPVTSTWFTPHLI